MTPLQATWRASLSSTRNVLRFDARMRVGTMFALLVQFALGIWGLTRLISTFAQWHALGGAVLNIHLWLTCLLAWGAIALFAVLATLMYGFGSDEALLLVIQPLEPATRLRALYSHVLWHGVGSWLLFEASLLGIALSIVSGWDALPWLLLLVLGALVVSWLSLFTTFLVVRYIVPRPGRALIYGLACALGCGLLILLGQRMHWDIAWRDQKSAGMANPLAALALLGAAPQTCLLIDGALLFFLLLVWFPLARRTGLFYFTVFQQQQGRDNSPRAFTWPGLGTLLALLRRWRTPIGALLFKGLLQQGRSLFAWLRLLVLVVLLALFPLLRPSLIALHLNGMLQVTFYAAILAFLTLFEYAPYAIGGEGARLALYLAAPLDPVAFLRARLCSYLLPALLIGWLATLLLGYWIGLSLFALLLALALLSLMLIGYITLTVLGSTLDADLTQVAEDTMQALMLEEMPVTLRRLQLLSLTILLFGAMFLLCWKLPISGALLALVGMDVVLLVVGERIGRVQFAHLLR